MQTENQSELRLLYVGWTLRALKGGSTPKEPKVTRAEMIETGIMFLDWVLDDLERLKENFKDRTEYLRKELKRQKAQGGLVNKRTADLDPDIFKKECGLRRSRYYQTFDEFQKALGRSTTELNYFDWYSNYIEAKLSLDKGGIRIKRKVVENLQEIFKKYKDSSISEKEKGILIRIFNELKNVIKEEPVAEIEAKKRQTVQIHPKK